MDPGLRTAATGMIAQQARVEVISHNLANVNTPGFKRSRAQFEDLLYQMIQGASQIGQFGADSLPAIQIGRGTRLAAVQRIHAQGPIEPTGRALDLAIEGEGFFQLEHPSGNLVYSRAGGFAMSDRGMLVNTGGYTLMPGITIPPETTQINISRNGIVTVDLAGTPDPVELGRIELAYFANPAGLQSIGENLYVETSASGPPVAGLPQEDGMGRLLQGALESSNVQIVQEMVDMIAALRAYEINAKAVQSAERMAEITNSLVR